MSIKYLEDSQAFVLETENTSYQMQVDIRGHLLHLYYGASIGDLVEGDFLYKDRGFSPNYYSNRFDRDVSPDQLPQEYSSFNVGDFRIPSVQVVNHLGEYGADFVYKSHEINSEKYTLEGLPASYQDGEERVDTLAIKLLDEHNQLELTLYYAVFEQKDVITRAASLRNLSEETLRIEKIASSSLDVPYGDWDLIHFHGRHELERRFERVPVATTITKVASSRGSSSHHHNPFVILADKSTNEFQGDSYGVMLAYSGNHSIEVEKDQAGLVRIVSGINSELFSWQLGPNEDFIAPETIFSFSQDGLNGLSQNYHKFINKNVMRGEWRDKERPVLINNWEATYFDFDSDAIYNIAKQAADLGIELMVLDDGWFGIRNDDNSGLGDWFVNEEKLDGGLDPLIERVNDLGMSFGIWFEPEMVNEDSDLYREHPEWALAIPGREPAMGRNQLVLDFSRKDVVDHIYGMMHEILSKHNISYVKWDMNRNMSDVYSHAYPADQQGEIWHRYILGVYDLLERLVSAFPDVLWEGCSGGGGRFDAGMLNYFSQIWLSDNTDAINRLVIQQGSSYGYPLRSMGTHVSASPNHQSGRSTSIDTRGVVAMSGTFGYELDLNKVSEDDKAKVKDQITNFKEWYELIQYGDLYRLTDSKPVRDYSAWQIVAKDKRESLLNLVLTNVEGNPLPIHIKFQGLNPDLDYEISFAALYDRNETSSIEKANSLLGKSFKGKTLMNNGLSIPYLYGDYPSGQILISAKD